MAVDGFLPQTLGAAGATTTGAATGTGTTGAGTGLAVACSFLTGSFLPDSFLLDSFLPDSFFLVSFLTGSFLATTTGAADSFLRGVAGATGATGAGAGAATTEAAVLTGCFFSSSLSALDGFVGVGDHAAADAFRF